MLCFSAYETTYHLGSARNGFAGLGQSIDWLIGFLNLFVRPALVVLTLPVTFLTLGLFLFIINALMFWAAAELLDGFRVNGFASALLGSLLYSTFGMVIDSALQHLFPPQPL